MRDILIFKFRLPENSKLLSCSNDGIIESKIVTYTSCFVTDAAMDSAMDLENGHVTIPAEGFYEISFTGAMKTFDGKRIWATIVKKTNGVKGSQESDKLNGLRGSVP